MNRINSFKTRLTLFNSLTLICAVLAASGVLFNAFDRVIDKEISNSLLNEARLIARIIDEDNDEFEIAQKAGLPVKDVDLEEDIREFAKMIAIQKEEDSKIYYSEKMSPLLLEKVLSMQTEIKPNTYFLEDLPAGPNKYRFLYYRYLDEEGRVYRISVGHSLKKVEWATKRFMLTLFVGLPLICLISSLTIYIISRQGLRPLDEIIKKAENITKERIETIPVNRKMPKEIFRLAKALNKMLSRLELAFDREKQFSAAASHELRTPLTALKGSMEVTLSKERSIKEYEDTVNECLEEVNHMIGIIDNLLLLAKLDETAFDLKSSEKIDVRSLLNDAREYAVPLATGIDFKVILNPEKPLYMRGKIKLLHQALYNLIVNAIKHGQPTMVLASAKTENGKIVIKISDNGKGIAEKDLPFLFDHFFRGDKARNTFGYGLGLAIVKAIVTSHHGEVTVYTSEGKGTEFSLTFPLA